MSTRTPGARRRAFTLVEVLIVVAVMGILFGIAVPNFVRARDVGRSRGCIENLRQIEGAREQAMAETARAAAPDLDELVGSYLRNKPVCPQDGMYDAGKDGEAPTCTVGAAGTTDTRDDHILLR